MDDLHFVLVLRGNRWLLLDKAIGCLGRIAKFENVMDLRVEYFLHAEVHPLPKNPSCVINLLIIDANLQLLPQILAG